MGRLLLFLAFLICYGSLYPFDFSCAGQGAGTLWGLLTDWSLRGSRGDALGNLGLLFPFGLVGALSLRGRWGGGGAAVLVLLMSLLLATGLQVAQLCLPSRVPAMDDVLWNLVGAGMGIAVGLLLVRGDGAERRWRVPEPAGVAICGIWLLSELLPLLPSLDWQGVKESLKPLLIEARFSFSDAGVHAAGVVICGQVLECAFPGRGNLLRLALILLGVLLAKLVVVTQVLDLSTVGGFGAGYLGWLWFCGMPESRRQGWLFLVLFLVVLVAALLPFGLRGTPGEFNWIPFAGLLHGSLLTNLLSLAERLFLYAALLWLVRAMGAPLFAASMALSMWIAVLEVAQLLLEGRSADITEPIWVLLCAYILRYLPLTGLPTGKVNDNPHEEESAPQRTPGPQTTKAGKRPFSIVWKTGLWCLLLVLAIRLVLQLPGMPYNVRELFQGEGGLGALFPFTLAVYWIGVGVAVAARLLVHGRYPLLILPLLVAGTALVSLCLLSASVTGESIRDIVGSSVLHRDVVYGGIWGEWGRELFLALNAPGLIAGLDRTVRYTALYGQFMLIFIMIVYVMVCPPGERGSAWWWKFLRILFGGLLWLWLCKVIVVDWAVTDNLTELIAEPGRLGVSGVVPLYLLVVIICSNASFIALHAIGWRRYLQVALFTSLMVPAGWWLLNAGLEQYVHKYGLVYSGVQFLLGPDRREILPDSTLFVRWGLLQLGVLAVLVIGLRLGMQMKAPIPNRQLFLRRHILPDSHWLESKKL